MQATQTYRGETLSSRPLDQLRGRMFMRRFVTSAQPTAMVLPIASLSTVTRNATEVLKNLLKFGPMALSNLRSMLTLPWPTQYAVYSEKKSLKLH